MTDHMPTTPRPLLLMIAGAKGAVASTVAAAAAALRTAPDTVLPWLTTGNRFSFLGPVENIHVAGWDFSRQSMAQAVARHGVLPPALWEPYRTELDAVQVLPPPDEKSFEHQVDRLTRNIHSFKSAFPGALAALVNLLPACDDSQAGGCLDIPSLSSAFEWDVFPDPAYVLAAIRSGVPVVNFSPNAVELPPIVAESIEFGVPLAGRDGKTGQTYLKVALASALKARGLYVDGWYSLNILGNADGKNLMDPCRAAGKVTNKTRLLDEILGYSVGEQYGEPAHKVHIEYYPPRGDAKEAWDVVDLKGLFGLPMSIRLNLQGRDSILAAPMVMDLARWVCALHLAGMEGPVADLGFFFKKPVGDDPPLTFQDQVAALKRLEAMCNATVAEIEDHHAKGMA